MKMIFRYASRYMGLLIFCLTTKTLASFAELAIPEILAIIIDDAVPRGSMSDVWLLGGVMLAFALLTVILNIVSNRFSARVSGRIARDIRTDLFRKTVMLDTVDIDRFGTSSLTSRLTSDTYNVSSFFGRLIRAGVRAPIMTVGGVILTLFIDWRLSLILIGLLPFIFIVVYVITKKTIPVYKEQQAVLDSIVTKVDETAKGIRVIKALSKTEYEKETFHERSSRLAKKEIEAGSLIAATKPLTDLILNIGLCLVILLGFILSVLFDFNATGKLLAFMTYFTIILNSMIMITRTFVQMSRAIASSSRISEVLSAKSIESAADSTSGGSDYIIFDDVSFSYNKKINNINHISFSIKEGETLGIIGDTGSGKSTIVSLLLGHYTPDSGNIYINGDNLRNISKQRRAELFGVAFQNDFIPRGTVRDTVAFFRPSTDEEIYSALKCAMAYDFVSELPSGLDYEVTTGGTNLSGGQRQRLLIARAILKPNDILILDDSSSALDYKTDSELRRRLSHISRHATIIIAQRISAVKDAHKIILIKNGELSAVGTHEYLMENCADYRKIAEVQMG